MDARRIRIIYILRTAAIIAAVGCICFGIFRNEHAYVLRKAIRICLECIGVG